MKHSERKRIVNTSKSRTGTALGSHSFSLCSFLFLLDEPVGSLLRLAVNEIEVVYRPLLDAVSYRCLIEKFVKQRIRAHQGSLLLPCNEPFTEQPTTSAMLHHLVEFASDGKLSKRSCASQAEPFRALQTSTSMLTAQCLFDATSRMVHHTMYPNATPDISCKLEKQMTTVAQQRWKKTPLAAFVVEKAPELLQKLMIMAADRS